MKAAKDARAKTVDSCRIVCPDQDDVTVVPVRLSSESAAGGRFLAAGKPNLLDYSATATKKATDLSFAPEESNMALSVDFIFTVE